VEQQKQGIEISRGRLGVGLIVRELVGGREMGEVTRYGRLVWRNESGAAEDALALLPLGGPSGTTMLRSDPRARENPYSGCGDMGFGLPIQRAERGEERGRVVYLSRRLQIAPSHVASRFHCRFHENGSDAADHWGFTS
jgi:hypothetical protein